MNTLKENIIQSTEIELNKIIDEWCNLNDNTSCSGGKMREKRGSDIETFVCMTINKIGELLNIDLKSLCGNYDKKELVINLSNGKK